MKEKESNIERIAEKIREKFGQDAITTLNPGNSIKSDVEGIPTGSDELNEALEIGGFPRGRITEIFGGEGSGKTTLTLHAIANCQEMGLVASFIDAEHSFDRKYAEAIGVDVSKLLFNQPASGEQALNILIALIKTRRVGLVVIDSVAALTPAKELKGDMEDQQMGLQARMMGKALRKIGHIVKKTNTAVIFINQVREKIGVMFGEKTTTPGGRALKFWAHLRVAVTRIKTIRHKGKSRENLVRVSIKKSKVSTPYRQAEFKIRFGRGIINGDE